MNPMVPGGHSGLVHPQFRSRKRTKAGRYTSDISYEELQKYFHLPTSKACVKLGVGLTILKRICRRFGLARWPYKKPCKGSVTNISDDNNDHNSGATASDATPYTYPTTALPPRQQQQQQWQQPQQHTYEAQSYEYQSHQHQRVPTMLQTQDIYHRPNNNMHPPTAGAVSKPVAVRSVGVGQALLDSLGLSSAPATGAEMTRNGSGGAEATAESLPDGMDMLLTAIERSVSPEPIAPSYGTEQHYGHQQQRHIAATMDGVATTNVGYPSLVSLPSAEATRQNSAMPTPFSAPLFQSKPVAAVQQPTMMTAAPPRTNEVSTVSQQQSSAMDQLKQLLATNPGLAQQLAQTLKQQQNDTAINNNNSLPSIPSNPLAMQHQQQYTNAAMARLPTAVSSSLHNSGATATAPLPLNNNNGVAMATGGAMNAPVSVENGGKRPLTAADAQRIQELSMKLANLQQKLAMRQAQYTTNA